MKNKYLVPVALVAILVVGTVGVSAMNMGNFPGEKMGWLKQNRPQVYEKLQKPVLPDVDEEALNEMVPETYEEEGPGDDSGYKSHIIIFFNSPRLSRRSLETE